MGVTLAGPGRPRRKGKKTKPIWMGQDTMTEAERIYVIMTLTPEERASWLLEGAKLKAQGMRIPIRGKDGKANGSTEEAGRRAATGSAD